MRLMVHSAQEHDELIAADTSYDIVGAEKVLHLLCEIGKEAVAEEVTESIVDLLEVIYIDDDERVVGLAAVGAQKALDKGLCRGLVVKLGERVALRLIDKALIRDLYRAYILDLADCAAVLAVNSSAVGLYRKSVPPVIGVERELKTYLEHTAVNTGLEVVADKAVCFLVLFVDVTARSEIVLEIVNGKAVHKCTAGIPVHREKVRILVVLEYVVRGDRHYREHHIHHFAAFLRGVSELGNVVQEHAAAVIASVVLDTHLGIKREVRTVKLRGLNVDTEDVAVL